MPFLNQGKGRMTVEMILWSISTKVVAKLQSDMLPTALSTALLTIIWSLAFIMSYLPLNLHWLCHHRFQPLVWEDCWTWPYEIIKDWPCLSFLHCIIYFEFLLRNVKIYLHIFNRYSQTKWIWETYFFAGRNILSILSSWNIAFFWPSTMVRRMQYSN